MARRRTVFLPPIMQVLEEGQHQHFYSEGVSIVIKWVDLNPVQLSPSIKTPKRPKTPLSQLMKTIDLRDSEPAKDGEEHFSYIVCFPEDDTVNDKDDSDTQTIYAQKFLPPSGASKNLGYGLFWKHNMLSRLTNAARSAGRMMSAKSVYSSASSFKGVQP